MTYPDSLGPRTAPNVPDYEALAVEALDLAEDADEERFERYYVKKAEVYATLALARATRKAR